MRVTTKFTPGPWKACKPMFDQQDIRQDPADWDGHGYQLICTVPQSTKGSHYGEMFQANARLIAAAPELVEALEMGYADTMDYIQRNRLSGAENNHWLVLARAAIAKATKS